MQCPDVLILCFVNESNSIIAANSPRKWSTNKSSFNKHNILCWQKLKQKIPHHFEFRCIKTMYAFIDDNTMYTKNRPLKRLMSSPFRRSLSSSMFFFYFSISHHIYFVFLSIIVGCFDLSIIFCTLNLKFSTAKIIRRNFFDRESAMYRIAEERRY